MDELIKKINEVQEKYGLNDNQLSLRLEMDPATWSRIKRGIQAPGADFLGTLANHFAELQLDILQYLIKVRGQTDARN